MQFLTPTARVFELENQLKHSFVDWHLLVEQSNRENGFTKIENPAPWTLCDFESRKNAANPLRFRSKPCKTYFPKHEAAILKIVIEISSEK